MIINESTSAIIHVESIYSFIACRNDEYDWDDRKFQQKVCKGREELMRIASELILWIFIDAHAKQ